MTHLPAMPVDADLGSAATRTSYSANSATPIVESLHIRKFLRRTEAAGHVRDQWGIPCATAWLAKLATVGGGPVFRKAGRFPIYAIEDLDDWARSRISEPVRSTSELDVAKPPKPP